MTWTTLAATLGLALLMLQDVHRPGPLSPPPGTMSHRMSVLRDWVSAVEAHVPDKADSAVKQVLAWTRSDVESIWTDFQVLIAAIKNPSASTIVLQPAVQRVSFRSVISEDDLVVLRELAKAMRAKYTVPDPFLKRAALLHGDIARWLSDDDPSSTWSSMMQPRTGVVRAEDGQQVSTHGGMVHWEFGRVLLDAVRLPGRDEFVRQWYRATLAAKLVDDELDAPHFEHGLRLFPNDPAVRFLLGCLYESFAEPRVQNVVEAQSRTASTALGIGVARDEWRTAEGHFRQVVRLDPSHAEARLHLGRTLGHLGRHQDAGVELRLAIDGLREPSLRYFAHLFLGAEEEALGRWSEARASYQAAAALYPRAQGPQMALSQLAHRTGDRAAARAALRPVLDAPRAAASKDADPWWTYRHAAGRHANAWRDEMYRLLSDGPRP